MMDGLYALVGLDVGKALQDLTPLLVVAMGGFAILTERRLSTIEATLKTVLRLMAGGKREDR